MNPILDEEDILVALDDVKNSSSNPGIEKQYTGDYEHRIAIQKQHSADSNVSEVDKEARKLTRQQSIELYDRENHTFRGYSFLNDNSNQEFNQNLKGAF